VTGTEVIGTVRVGGEAQANLFLQLHRAGSNAESSTPKNTSTNHEGVYCFKSVEPGEYTILVTKTGDAVGSYSIVSREITVPRGSPFKYDIDLPGACIAGKVVDRAGHFPLKSVRVVLLLQGLKYGSGLLADSMGSRVAEVYTDDQGCFRITNLQAGKYDLRAGGSNLLGMDSGGYAFRMFEGIRLSEDEENVSLTIELEKGGILEGRVTDAGGEPISGASIHVCGPGQPSFQEHTECRTEGSGFYRYIGLMPGTWTVRICHADYSPFIGNSVSIEKEKSSTLDCVLRP
ncbi:MAG: carboxypeptidase-like regulatory domain-containing protein, partial [Planctomycetota bacterium]